ncbi:LytTR family DNA-binding domain-containing protein [Hyphobacterium sp.]|uniref:LytTR family DNA-binding domain-containing protein n=1 Tax=Hyphobacterium sp. TaxID=2004662 RepID=UPI003BAB7A78
MPGWVNQLFDRAGGPLFLLGVGTFLAFLGPYNTSGLGWPWVWLYWTGLLILGGMTGNLTAAVFNRFFPNLPVWTSYSLIAVIISIPVTAAVIGIQAALGPMPPPGAWPVIFFFVLLISGAVTALTYMLDRPDSEATEPVAGRALTDKLPVRLRTAEILALESEDHYLRVHTSRGDDLILMRLSDAMAALEGLDGMQTHRSWWVARAAIADAEKSGGRAELTLSNGIKAPVSRSFYPRWREKGWI